MNQNNAGCVQAANNQIQDPWFQSCPARWGCGAINGNPDIKYQALNVITASQPNSFTEAVAMSGNGQIQAVAYGNSCNALSYVDIYQLNNGAGQNKNTWVKSQTINFNSAPGATDPSTTNGCMIAVNIVDACQQGNVIQPVGANINNSNNPQCQNKVVTCGEGIVATLALDYCGEFLAVGAPTLGTAGAGFIFQGANGCFTLALQMENQTPNADQALGQSVAVSGDGTRAAFGLINCGINNSTACQNPQGEVLIVKVVNCNCFIMEQALTLDNANVVQNFGCNPLMPNHNANGLMNNTFGNLFGTAPPGQGTNNAHFLGLGNKNNNNNQVGSCCVPGQTLFGQSVALDALGNTLAVGGNNAVFVFSATQTVPCFPCVTNPTVAQCLPQCFIVNTNTLDTCNNGVGPFTLTQTLVGTIPNGNNINDYNQGIAVALSASGSSVAFSSNLGSNANPVVPATVWVFDRNTNAVKNGKQNTNVAFQQQARIVGSKGKQRVGAPAASMGLFLSADGRYVTFSDPNWSATGSTTDGAVWSFMRQVLGAVEQTRIESPTANAQFGTTLAIPQPINMLSVTASNTGNNNGSGATFVFV
jgi:hypothetical protein